MKLWHVVVALAVYELLLKPKPAPRGTVQIGDALIGPEVTANQGGATSGSNDGGGPGLLL